MKKMIFGIASLAIGLLMAGCGTFELQTSAKMTKSIFFKDLKPEKTIYLVSTNTTSLNSILGTNLKADLKTRGYSVVDDPNNAKYILKVNLLNNNSSLQQNEAKAAGVMAASGAIVAGAATRSLKDAAGAGLAVGAVGGLFAYATADGTVRMQADVLITEIVDGDELEYETRIIAEATKVHLTPEEGQSILEASMSKKIAGIFI